MTPQIKQRISQIQNGEIPKGYKSTQLGIIPCDWEESLLKDIGLFSKGRGISGNDMGDKGLPCIGYGDIYTRFDIHFDKAQNFISDEIANESRKVKAGALLFTCSGETALEIGKCVCYIGNQDLYVGGDIAILEVNNKINPVFVSFQQSLFPSIKKKAQYGQGHSVVHIYPNELGKLQIAYPKDISEQNRIAEILSTQDRLIEQQEKLISQKEKQKKYLMQVLLTGKKRLKGFNGEWEEKELSSYAKRVVKKNKNRSNNVLTISAQYGLVSQETYFNNEIASTTRENYYYLERNEFAYNKSYSQGYPYGAIKRLRLYDCGIVSTLYICFNVNNKASYLYLEQYFEAGLLNMELRKVTQEGARNHGLLNIAVQDFFQLKILLPPLPEQQAIAEILSTVDKEIELLKKQLEHEKQKKKSLMQLLLTGIVRV